ncbi:hypothetical protein [Marinilabilia rubra]|uniref:hypothetical protein n=1 Tax=Marinilabilia rubra TaxID=2162893 RepID=UPI0018E0A62C|nr:hypothetical protein [Marinilabilia rubra]
MTKNGKNIALFFLWLAGLVIFSHEIIPHHHHFHSVYTHTHTTHGDDCDHSHKSGDPFDDASNHCHAFNDITVERQNLVKIPQPVIDFDFDLFLSLFLVSEYVEEDVSFYRLYYDPESVSDQFLLFVSPHRGPPMA